MSALPAERPAPVARRATAKRAMVATAHPLASQAALEVLSGGGNAVDAAIAAAAVLGVVQPMMSGLGGDTFMLVRSASTGVIRSINGSGGAPAALSLAWAANAGLQRLPDRGMLSASVPGAVGAMFAAHGHFGSGRHSLKALLQPAIRWAADGVPLSPSVGRFFKQNAELLLRSDSTARIYVREGRVIAEGEILRQPELARTLDMVAQGGAEAFYRGEFARRLIEHSRANGGLFEADDLAQYACEIVEPISLPLPQGVMYSNPPVAQGMVLLEALGILARCSPGTGVSRTHRMVESVKLAFVDRNRYLGDPRFVSNPIEQLLGDKHLSARARRIDDERAIVSIDESWLPFGDGDTTSLSVADGEGNFASLITSLSTPFGAAQVIEGTGVLMNNRAGRGFTLDASAPNCLDSGKRTMSTLHTYMLCDSTGVRLTAEHPAETASPNGTCRSSTPC